VSNACEEPYQVCVGLDALGYHVVGKWQLGAIGDLSDPPVYVWAMVVQKLGYLFQ
jgi:hypothetical protein